MRIAVCDDSLDDRERTVNLLHQYFCNKSVLHEIIQYTDGRELLFDFEEDVWFDVVFLDVYVKELLGIDVARKLRRMGYEGHIVFLTGSTDFAMDGYDVEATAYLLKTQRHEKLFSVLDKITRGMYVNTYQVQQYSKIVRIPYAEILYVESNNSKCILHRSDGQVYTIYKHLQDIEEELRDRRFFRCHRSFLINMDYIQQMEDHFVLSTGDIVLIRQRNKKEIRQKVLDYMNSKIKPYRAGEAASGRSGAAASY